MTTANTITGQYTGKTWTAHWISLPGTPIDDKWAFAGPDGAPGCWTFQDDKGFGFGIGRASHRHPSAHSALVSADGLDLLVAAQGLDHDRSLTREAYEAEAKRLGLATWDDAGCRAMVHGDWDIETYGITGAAARTLGSRRGYTLRDAEPAFVYEPPLPVPTCRNCGLEMLAAELDARGFCLDCT